MIINKYWHSIFTWNAYSREIISSSSVNNWLLIIKWNVTEIRWILLTIMNRIYVWRQFTLDKMKVWVAQSCPTLWPYAMWPTRLLCPWNFPGKNTWVGCHFLLQRNFPTQGSNLGLLLCRRIIIWATRESQIKLEESSIQRASLVAQR